jgi:hypothetical protein
MAAQIRKPYHQELFSQFANDKKPLKQVHSYTAGVLGKMSRRRHGYGI